MSVRRDRRDLIKGLAGGASAAWLGSWLTGCGDKPAPEWSSKESGSWVGGSVPRGHQFRDAGHGAVGEPLRRRAHTIIVGAGVAGLSAARVLQRCGLDDFVVLELEDQAGGNARAHQLGGMACPLGAHYLPVPGDQAPGLAQWLEELRLIRREHGRWVGDERHLCHAPHERIFVPEVPVPTGAVWRGAWHEGLMQSQAPSSETRRQFALFAKLVQQTTQACAFAMPTEQARWSAAHTALDLITFADWVQQSGLNDPRLMWYLDYVCRDDYGASMTRVSAWAGLQYFAGRHDLRHDDWHEDASPVLTWPQGNAWLTQQLAQPLSERLKTAQIVMQIEPQRQSVAVRVWSEAAKQHVQWQAQHVILAVPLFVARRMLGDHWPALSQHAARQAYAPWLVSNLLIQAPLLDRAGASLAWDNVIYADRSASAVGVPSLGYVHAGHQNLDIPVGEQVWTHYWALGGTSASDAQRWRQSLLQSSWQTWAQHVVDDLAVVHPDLPTQLKRIDLMRYGHAMAIPEPGVRSAPALQALRQAHGRLHLAHADLSAYSVLEEAFAHGQRAAYQVLSASGISRRIV